MDILMKFLTDVIVPLAWPFVAVYALFTFRHALRDAVNRLVKAGPKGLEMSPQSSGATLRAEAGEFSQDSNEAFEQETWGHLQPWLEMLERNLARVGKTNDISEVKKLAAAYDRRAGAQYLLRVIFGTQYEALLRILDEPRSLSELDDLYEEHLKRAGDVAHPTPESWLGWLTENGIVYAMEGKYVPTELGKSVVDLLVAHGISARHNFG